jgi:hypothetical protein
MADQNGEKPPSLPENNDETTKQGTDEVKSQVSTKSTRYLKLKNMKEAAKARLTKARNQAAKLTTGHPSTKTEIRRAIKKVKAESDIIEKIIYALKETVVLSDEALEGTDVDTVIENFAKELYDIMDLVDTTINYANDHIKERLVNGEDESEVSTIASSKISINSMATKSSHAKSSHVTPP